MQRGGWNLLQMFSRASERQETGLTRAFYDIAVCILAVCDFASTRFLCCCSEGSLQSGKVDQREFHRVQQREMSISAPGEE